MNLPLVSLAVIIATLPACAAPPGGERPVPAQAAAPRPSLMDVGPPDRSNEGVAIRFVAEKRAYNARRLEELRSRGRAGDLPIFQKWVRERSTPVEGPSGLTPETLQAVQKAFADEIALRMAAYGFTADQVSALHAQGVDVVEALEITKSHVAPLRNAAILAEQVVLAEFIGADLTEDLGDGAGATIRLRVIETLKGDAPIGRVYELRMPAEWTAGQPPVSTMKRDDRFLLFASTARYRHDANLRGASTRPSRPFLTFNEMELITVEGDRVHGTHTTPVTSLQALRAELKPLAQTGSPPSMSPAAPQQPEHARRNVLLGDWYVTSVAGEAAARGEPAIEVAMGEKTIQAKAHCLRFHWEYSRSGKRIAIRPQRNVLVASCHRGMSPWERSFSKAMLSAAAVSTRQDEFTTISGVDGIVTLRRRWYVKLDDGYSLGTWQVVAIGGSPLATGDVIRLSINPSGKVEARSQCLRWLWSYSRGTSNSVTVTKENPGLVCARGLTRNEKAFVKILDGASTIDQREDGTMLIRGAGGDILAHRI